MNFIQIARDIRKIAKSYNSGVINIDSDGGVWHRDFVAARATYVIDLESRDVRHWTEFEVKEFIDEANYEISCYEPERF